MDPEKKVVRLKATHSFVPNNNDELKFEKGDIIVLTQKEDGGWWEGTHLLNGKTGWFPSNYVEELHSTLDPGEDPGRSPDLKTGIMTLDPCSESTQVQTEYRLMVLSDILDSETAYHGELQGIWNNFLIPLAKEDILIPLDYKVLVGNLLEIIKKSESLIASLTSQSSLQPVDQRIGKIFLDLAPEIERIHTNYCSNHPKALQIIESSKERLASFFEGKGATPPGSLVLLMALAQPIQRLSKYYKMLQEFERHVEEFHKDRGDVQRSVEYFKEIEQKCEAIRKQKELELEVLGGSIKNWEGADILQLGNIIYMTLVSVGPESLPRYFVLFPNTLLILSMSPEGGLVYEGKLPITGITLNMPPGFESNNSFEISGPMIEPISVTCSTRGEKLQLLEHLNKILMKSRFPSRGGSTTSQSFGDLSPPVTAWEISRLRPAPPFNPFLTEFLQKAPKQGHGGKTNPMSQITTISTDDEFAILALVDSFCAKNRQMSASTDGNGNKEESGKDSNMSEVVLSLREELSSLKSSMSMLQGKLTEEEKARKTLQSMVQSQLGPPVQEQRSTSPRPFDPSRLNKHKNKD